MRLSLKCINSSNGSGSSVQRQPPRGVVLLDRKDESSGPRTLREGDTVTKVCELRRWDHVHLRLRIEVHVRDSKHRQISAEVETVQVQGVSFVQGLASQSARDLDRSIE